MVREGWPRQASNLRPEAAWLADLRQVARSGVRTGILAARSALTRASALVRSASR